MNIREYVEAKGWHVEVLEDHGLQDRDPFNYVDAPPAKWQHYSYRVRVHNGNGQHFDSPWAQGTAITASPTEQVAEIVDSLLSDVWSYQQARDFEDWALDFGYDTDSRKAEKLYRQIAAMEPGVVALFGDQDEFERVATEVERL
ncbi:hypothetical protein A5747_13440 [Mycobacterium sp. IS-836]|uniref:hypothetical protein n=1 Tax=Mycobacterium sp. IS-836 TaxID=1834160 RepID=UPI00096C1F5D|nr:hypothetical protein [Mycobacterium sp. IS-836]OMC55391.1 hypothetical protein A5747_13440 [Mycobacterium sp. IS-836]